VTRAVAEPDPGRIVEGAEPRGDPLGWFLVLYFLLNFGQGVFPPVLPQVMDSLGLSFSSAGLLGMAFGLARFVVDLPAGILIERLGVVKVLHAAVGFLLLGTGLSAWAASLPAMLLARGLVGIGSGMSIVVSILYLMRRGSPGQRSRRGNVYEIAVIGGTAASAALGGAIAARLGWRWSFAMAGLVITLGWLIATIRVLPGVREALQPEGSLAPPHPQQRPLASWGMILPVYLATFSLAVGWAGGISTFLPLYGGRGLGLTPEILGRTMAIAYGIEVCLLVPIGWLSDVLGRVRVMVPGLLVMLAGILVVPNTQNVPTYTLACSLVVTGMTVWMNPPALLAERLPNGFRGKAAGLYRFVADLGYILSPLAIGWSIEFGGFRSTALWLAGITLAAVLSNCWWPSHGPMASGTSQCRQ